jgi:hypothetical protein
MTDVFKCNTPTAYEQKLKIIAYEVTVHTLDILQFFSILGIVTLNSVQLELHYLLK